MTYWEAYYRLEPWGDDWVQTARLEAAIINTQCSEKVSPAELIPNEDNRQQTDELDEVTLISSWKSRLGF